MKKRRGCSSSIWLCKAVTSMPLSRKVFKTGLTSFAVSTKSPVIAALPEPVGWKLMTIPEPAAIGTCMPPSVILSGVYGFNIPRADRITDGGMQVPIAAGSGIVINFQPTGSGKAAITGDFVLTAKEVNPVLKTLRDNGIEVTALHSHMLEEQPRLFFMHYWANDDAQKLATGLKAALSKVNLLK